MGGISKVGIRPFQPAQRPQFVEFWHALLGEEKLFTFRTPTEGAQKTDERLAMGKISGTDAVELKGLIDRTVDDEGQWKK